MLCIVFMYADDTTIYFNLEDFGQQNTEVEFNTEVEEVNTWLKLNKLSLNVKRKRNLRFFTDNKNR